MGSQRPPNWSFAARAAYFGDQLCPFCDHRNPAGAKFCNDCASPLHLKPCKRCDAVNHASAMSCHKCGAVYPATLKPGPSPAWRAPELGIRPSGVDGVEGRGGGIGSGWHSNRIGQVLMAAIVTVLITSAYSVYRTSASRPVARSVVSRPNDHGAYDASTAKPPASIATQSQFTDAREREASVAVSVPPAVVEPKPVESVGVIIAGPANANAEADATNRVATTTTPLTAPKQASAQQRATSERRGHAGTSDAQRTASARAAAHGAESRNALRAPASDVMKVSLARCSGDLIARIVCEQRLRQRFCEGRWGKAPECATGAANEHRR